MKSLSLSHILVQHQYEAEDLQRRLQRGEDFATLAQKQSKCPSAKAGGSLGEVPLHRLEETFREAAEILKPGETSGIVRTPFGYHLIKRN